MSTTEHAGPEPGTDEWAVETGNYIDPEPEWDAGGPYVDHAHGVIYHNTPEAMDAGQERWPSYRHVGTETGTGHQQPAPEPFPEPPGWGNEPEAVS